MFNTVKLHKNEISCIINGINRHLLHRRINISTTSTSKLIIDAHQSCFNKSGETIAKEQFHRFSNNLKNCIFSKQEAACALRFCLDLEHFDPILFRNIIKVLEDEYFKPVLCEDLEDTSHELYNITKKNVSNTYEFMNSLSIKDKTNIVIWTWLINKETKKRTRRIKIHKRTEEIDPEKKEVYVTRRTRMVLDPIPIRARVSYIPPGKRLSNTLAFQLRESVPECSLPELCNILHIFSTPLPLSGQLNEDTMDLIAQKFSKYEVGELAKNIYSVSSFCKYASKRFLDIWSFTDPNQDRVPTRGKILYKFEKRKLDKRFINKVLESIEEYANSNIELENYKGYLDVTSDISVHLHILNNFANSDIEIPINTWEGLIVKLVSITEEQNKFEMREIGLFCDTLIKVKYTTPNTLNCARMMIKSFTISEEMLNHDYYLMSQILEVILMNGLNEGSSEIIKCVCTLALNNIERIELDNKLKLVKNLDRLSDSLNESERLELRDVDTRYSKKISVGKQTNNTEDSISNLLRNKLKSTINSDSDGSSIVKPELQDYDDIGVWYTVHKDNKGDEKDKKEKPSTDNKKENVGKDGARVPEGGDGEEPRKFNFDRWCKDDKLLISTYELNVFNAGSLLETTQLNTEGYTDYCGSEENNDRSLRQEGYSFTTPGKLIVKFLVAYTVVCQGIVLTLMCNELCIPIVSSIGYWDERARPFFVSWLVGFFTLLITFLVKNTKLGKNLFLVRVPLETCTYVKVSDHNKSSTEHDILHSTLDLIRNFIIKLKLFFNISDAIFKIPFERYKVVKHCYLPVHDSEGERYFYYHYVKYTYSEELLYFLDATHKVNGYLKNTNLVQLLDNGGLTEEESERRTEDIGYNEILVERVGFWLLLYREVSDPVFFMQLYLTIKSIFWRSYISAPIWGLTTLYTIYKKVRIIHEQQNDIYNLTTSSNEKYVTVMRDNVTKKVMTKHLAVGDIVRVENDWEVPSDMIMLRGDAIVDESSITGESIPLKRRKIDLDKYLNYDLNIYDFIHRRRARQSNSDQMSTGRESEDKGSERRDAYNFTEGEDNTEGYSDVLSENLLKSGTRVISVLGNEEMACSAVGVVIATGVFTTKGRQMKGVLFPNQFRLKYDTQLPLVFILTFIYALFCSYYQIRFLGWNMTSIFYSIGTMSQVVPVWTSTIISISQSRACQRLSKSESIYCIAPSRIAVCGKLRVMCFDKTGTLTNNKLIFNGSKYFIDNDLALLKPERILENLNILNNLDFFSNTHMKPYLISMAVATCHSLWPSDTPEQYGNNVDKSMFNCTGCHVDQYIDENGKNKRYIRSNKNKDLVMEILNTFDFDYQKKLSSVVVLLKINDESKRVVFVKGAFENLSLCCNHELENLAILSNNESSNGSYVLGLAYKVIGEEEDVTSRNTMESNLNMLSLLIFNNQVRAESRQVVQTLNEAMVRSVILTGDNIPASQYVAKKCNIIQPPNAQGERGEEDKEGDDADTADKERQYPIAVMNNNRIEWKYPYQHVDEEKLLFSEEYNEISMTGDVFDFIENNWNEILAKYGRFSTNETNNQTQFQHFLMKIRIFARLNPNQKVRVINSFKRLGIITGMCGDGTNDCLALQASHAGISLTSGATSMVSPFSSMNNKLESVIYLIREGRGSLVTCLACFKFMLLFGLMIAFVKVTLFRLSRGVMPEWGYLLIENAIMLLLSYTMALSRPSEKLRIRSPTSSLLGPLTLISVGVMFFVNISFLFMLFKLYEKLGVPTSLKYNTSQPPAAWWILSDNFEAPTVCMWLCYQVVNTALVFSFGGVFRESIVRNTYFTSVWLFINSFITYLVFTKPNRLSCLFRINCTDEVSKMTKIPVLGLLTTSARGLPFHGEHSHNVLPLKFKVRPSSKSHE
ncbi:P-type ATPase [Theileria orientalis strain Shintoku]|uniref:P-type ATPase n=1 Tax=Theileria orientalis strain Shintoku TaxID=869250 RepID=J4D684_THEOR|nr:P-type ATPase [Theileria orientalis strain Shintoku]BAM39410.1 P-type ATPase [Theileria orientalis strain Shintoku]|eukprot:XP_009689711.1 P-type ATPase [Theileria orientalis strain Shintoku]